MITNPNLIYHRKIIVAFYYIALEMNESFQQPFFFYFSHLEQLTWKLRLKYD